MFKFVSINWTIIAAITAIAATLGNMSNTTAASLSFTDPGRQLDTDAINDILQSGGFRQFDIFLNLGANEFGNPVDSLDVDISTDVTELTFANFRTSPGVMGGITSSPVTGRAVLSIRNLNAASINAPSTTSLALILYRVSNPTVNDGIFDFKLNGVRSAILNNGNNVTNAFTANQQVEVQPPCIGSVPKPSIIAHISNILRAAFISPVHAQTFPPTICVPVSEPSPIIGILALGTLGAGVSALKRRQNNQKLTEK